MSHTATSQRATTDLIADAAGQLTELVRDELTLAKHELRDELARAKTAAGAYAIAASLGAVGAHVTLTTLSLALARRPLLGFAFGAGLVAAAVVCARAARASLPEPLVHTRERLAEDVRAVEGALGKTAGAHALET